MYGITFEIAVAEAQRFSRNTQKKPNSYLSENDANKLLFFLIIGIV